MFTSWTLIPFIHYYKNSKVKILHIINNLNTGGAEKLVLETIPLYVEQGIAVDLLLLNGSEYPFLEELNEKKCCTVYSVGTSSVYNPLLIFKLIPFLKKYNLVHVHLFPAQYWVVLAKLFSFSKVSLVFTEHNTSNRRLSNAVLRFFDKYCYRFYVKIICISNEIQQLLKEHTRLPSKRFELIENGVKLKQFNDAIPYTKVQLRLKNVIESDTLLLQVAGFRVQKDQSTLIKALTLLPENVKLLLVGQGEQQKIIEALVIKLNLKERVHFLGVRTDVPRLLKSCDISFLSTHWEGFGLVAVEGMASGKPFIASDVPGLKEVVQGAGILFEKGNHKELAEIIQKLMDDPNYYQQITKSCLERSKQYDISTMVNKHITLYKSLIAE